MAGSSAFPPPVRPNGQVYSLHYDSVSFAYTPQGTAKEAYLIRDSKDFKNKKMPILAKIRHHGEHTRSKCAKKASRGIIGIPFLELLGDSRAVTNAECRTDYKKALYNGISFSDYYGYGHASGWREILQAYSLPNEPIAISEYDIWRVLEKAADEYHAQCKKITSLAFWENFLFIITAIVTIASVGTLAPVAMSVGAMSVFVSIVSIGAGWAIQANLDRLATNNAEAISKLDAQNHDLNSKIIAQQSAQITNTLIFATDAMFPSNQIYAAQKAGSQTFSPSQAYDPNKGILGQYNKDSFDEFTQNRAQVNLAGGVSFMSNLLNVDFPLATIEAIDTKAGIKAINQECYAWQLRLNHCFDALAYNGFGVGYGENDKTVSNIMQKAINHHITKRQKMLEVLDTLEKLKNYNRGLRLELPMNLNQLKKQSTKSSNTSTSTASGGVSEWERHTKAYLLSSYKGYYDEWLASADSSDIVKFGYSFYSFMLKMLKKYSEINSNKDKGVSRQNVGYYEPLAKKWGSLSETKPKGRPSIYSWSILLDSVLYKRIEASATPAEVLSLYKYFFAYSGYDKNGMEQFHNNVYIPPSLSNNAIWNQIGEYHTRQQEYSSTKDEYYNLLDEYQDTSALLDAKIEAIEKRIESTKDELESLRDISEQTKEALQSKKAEKESTKNKIQKEALQKQIDELESNLQDLQAQIDEQQTKLEQLQARLGRYKKQDNIIIEMMMINYPYIMQEYYESSQPTQAQKQAMQEARQRFYELDRQYKELNTSADSKEN